MSSKAYQEVYHLMTDKQKDIMYDLLMKGINYDGHVMNKFCDIEDAVAGIVKEQIGREQDAWRKGVMRMPLEGEQDG